MSAPNMLDLDYEGFQSKPELKGHLAKEAFVSLARNPHREFVVDCTAARRSMRSGFLLALSWIFSRKLAQATQRQRVGIVFPPGIGGFVANLAVVLAGKVPVNLNFTLGPAASESCIQRAEIDCLVTTQKVQDKMPDFPWPETGIIDLVEVLRAMPKVKTLGLLIAIYLLPATLLAKLFKVPSEGGDREAALLFTSGSSGEPKGVVLSHSNILGNCAQIDTAELLPVKEKLLASLPIFHSFGFTVTLWYPLLRGCGVVTVPSPLEVKKITEVISKESATVLLGTPTFFKPYLKYAKPEQLKSLKYVISGAEKTPEGFAEQWEATFGSQYFEGYGLTETSPVTSVNLPTKPKGADYPGSSDAGNRPKSVGRLFPGMSARIVEVDTGKDLPISETGLLYLRGPNIFCSYLNDTQRTSEVMKDGWFVTGDLARIDDDGFIYIEGRLSRFSKIGGEMVPHGTIEEMLYDAFEARDIEVPVFAIAGRPDPAKGESIVLLSALEIQLSDVRDKLKAAGLSNLWIPKTLVVLDAIPVLATGKLDLRTIQEIARTAE